MIRRKGGIVVRILRNDSSEHSSENSSENSLNHSSEKEIDEITPDFVINNSINYKLQKNIWDNNVKLIEDAAEALGATYQGGTPGSMGWAGIHSFNGNKIITTSQKKAHPEKNLDEPKRKNCFLLLHTLFENLLDKILRWLLHTFFRLIHNIIFNNRFSRPANTS